MKDIMGLMKKAGEMQAKMQEMQEEAANAEVEGTAGGGLVTVTLSGKGEMRSTLGVDVLSASAGKPKRPDDGKTGKRRVGASV